jgi:hypothetical protein
MALGETVSQGFGLGFGAWIGIKLASMLFSFIGILIGLIFFVPGLLILIFENKKAPNKQRNGVKLVGLVLIALGVLIGFGLGGALTLGTVVDEV